MYIYICIYFWIPKKGNARDCFLDIVVQYFELFIDHIIKKKVSYFQAYFIFLVQRFNQLSIFIKKTFVESFLLHSLDHYSSIAMTGLPFGLWVTDWIRLISASFSLKYLKNFDIWFQGDWSVSHHVMWSCFSDLEL